MTETERRNPWNLLWPALIFVAVLVAGIAMLDHEDKPDPKPTPLRPVTVETAGTNTIDGPRCIELGGVDHCTTPAQCVEQGDGVANCVDQPGQHWLRCNAGLEVTDMRYCPAVHPQIHAYVTRNGGISFVPVCPGDTVATKRGNRNLNAYGLHETLLIIANTVNEMGERVCEAHGRGEPR